MFVNMNESTKKLNFDSDLFGYLVARIEKTSLNNKQLEHILQNANKEKYKLLYWIVSPKDSIANKAASDNNGFLADKKVTYVRQLSDSAFTERSKNIVSYMEKPLIEALRSLALQAVEYSRFSVDPNFKNDECKKLYVRWMENSLSGDIAKEVFVYCEAGYELGLITLGEKDKRCDISILAVDEQFRGKGIGGKLIESAFSYAKEKSYDTIQVVTQKENKRACGFYEKCGFIEESCFNVYHFWL